jgi:hypothetical protein
VLPVTSTKSERDFELVERIVPRLVDPRRLAGRPDEQAREQVAQRRVPLPVDHEALEQIGAADERRIEQALSAEHDVVAAAGADRAAVDHELVGGQPDLAR